MTAFLMRRFLMLPLVMFGVLMITFFLIHLTPGDPALLLAGDDAPPETVERIRRELGLDRPVWEQFMVYLGRMVRGDLGRSIMSRKTVASEIRETLPNTLELILLARLWSALFPIPIAIVAAVRRGSLFDKSAMVGAIVGLSMPIFWVGLVLMWFFAYRLGWFPLSGRGGPIWTWVGFHHLIIPAGALGATYMASLARLTRSSMLEVLRQEYITTARAKGLRERVVVYKHAFRNALLPVITVIGTQTVHMIGGAVVTETIFSWPGMGRLSVGAVMAKDYPVVQGVVIVTSLAAVLLNLLVDLLYAYIDPKIRYG